MKLLLLLSLVVAVLCDGDGPDFRLVLKSDQQPFGRQLVSFYLLQVSMGSDDQKLQLLADTGSWAPIAMTTQCTAAVCLGEPRFNASKSTTYNVIETGLKNSYGAGTFVFNKVTDRFCFGGESKQLCFDPDLDWGAITDAQVRAGSLFGPFSGIVGLGIPHNGPVLTSVFTRWEDAAILKQNGISFYLPRPALGQPHTDGHLQLGSPDPDSFEGDLAFAPVVLSENFGNFPFWVVHVTGVGVAGNTSSRSCSDGDPCAALIDSGGGGFFAIGIPEWDSVFDIEPDCSNIHNLPNISMTIADTLFVFTPNDYVEKIDGVCYSDINVGNDWQSRGSVYPRRPYDEYLAVRERENRSMFVLGVPFLQRVFTFFDAEKQGGNQRVGFAYHK